MKLAKIESVYRPNLLVNGDFQINQRGQSSYSISTSNQLLNTLDCWILHATANNTSSTITPLSSGGITIQGNGDSVGVLQYISPYEFVLGNTYTISISFDSQIYYGSVTISEYATTYTVTFGSSSNTLNLNWESASSKILFSFYIKDSNLHTIKFIRINEGNILYKNFKEDYATAMMRCKPYVNRVLYDLTSYVVSASTAIRQSLNIPNMVGVPTITVLNAGTQTNIESILETVSEFNTSALRISITASNSGQVRVYSRSVLLSCEGQS